MRWSNLRRISHNPKHDEDSDDESPAMMIPDLDEEQAEDISAPTIPVRLAPPRSSRRPWLQALVCARGEPGPSQRRETVKLWRRQPADRTAA